MAYGPGSTVPNDLVSQISAASGQPGYYVNLATPIPYNPQPIQLPEQNRSVSPAFYQLVDQINQRIMEPRPPQTQAYIPAGPDPRFLEPLPTPGLNPGFVLSPQVLGPAIQQAQRLMSMSPQELTNYAQALYPASAQPAQASTTISAAQNVLNNPRSTPAMVEGAIRVIDTATRANMPTPTPRTQTPTAPQRVVSQPTPTPVRPTQVTQPVRQVTPPAPTRVITQPTPTPVRVTPTPVRATTPVPVMPARPAPQVRAATPMPARPAPQVRQPVSMPPRAVAQPAQPARPAAPIISRQIFRR